MITIVGPTASGKTSLAVALAKRIEGDIISADSRQVYRGMDIGTGKDLSDYGVGEESVSYHLIDICEAGTKYNLFEYQKDFAQVYNDLESKGIPVILCGGTGLYVEAVLKGYELYEVPENPALREDLRQKSKEELSEILRKMVKLHNSTDLDSKARAIRAIEIATYQQSQCAARLIVEPIQSTLFALDLPRDIRREKISRRLRTRLDEGMVEEVRGLLDKGIAPDDLIYYGLEYKFVTQYLVGNLSYDEMFLQLEQAIHQFSKRQMTWFRGMERRGFTVHWLDALRSVDENVDLILSITPKFNI